MEKFHHKNFDYVHQADGEYRSIEINELDGEKVFIKKYLHLNQFEIEEIFKKYCFFYKKLQGTEIRIPKPMSFKENEIIFEFVDLPDARRSNNMMLEGGKINIGVVERIAEILVTVHNVGKQAGYNHGDFGYGNIFLFSNHVYVIDLEPPPPMQLEHKDVQLLREKEFDMGVFLFSLFTLTDSTFAGYIKNLNKEHSAFLSFYTKCGGCYSNKKLKKIMLFLIKERYVRILRGERTVWYKAPFHLILLTCQIIINKQLRGSLITW